MIELSFKNWHDQQTFRNPINVLPRSCLWTWLIYQDKYGKLIVSATLIILIVSATFTTVSATSQSSEKLFLQHIAIQEAPFMKHLNTIQQYIVVYINHS